MFTPPGNRHAIPTTAIGSVPAFSAISRRADRSSILRSASVMIARRSGVAVVICGQPSLSRELLQQLVFRELVVVVGGHLLRLGKFGKNRGQVVGESLDCRIVENDCRAELFAQESR